MIDLGANVKAQDWNGRSPLYAAANMDYEDVFHLLCDKANENVVDNNGKTLLHRAAKLNLKSTVGVLAKKGADIHARDSNGDTLLHRAAREGNKRAAKRLLHIEAERDGRNDQESTP
ncbi:ankyrin repeat-containing domain protein, partial [Phaeosphaeriaceae sp. PMI808]